MNTRGILAELRAVAWLRRRGYRVRQIRWRGGGGEIDLVAEEHGLTVFVEVKSSPRMGEGALRVDARKARHLQNAADAYMRQYGVSECRFDILEESDAGFRVIKGAF